MLKVSTDVDYQKFAFGPLLEGQTSWLALALAHAQLLVPWTRATHAPEINQPSSSPVTTSELAPLLYHSAYTQTSTFEKTLIEIVLSSLWLVLLLLLLLLLLFVLLVILCVDDTSKNKSLWQALSIWLAAID